MKKFRGKKRYFRNLEKEISLGAYNLDFSDATWFVFWHPPLDFMDVKMDRYGCQSYITTL